MDRNDMKSKMAHLLTEQRNVNTMDIDSKSIIEIIDIINREDAKVHKAVAREKRNIARAVKAIVESLKKGGSLYYVGAGTSGRLGVLDAAECPPTFSADPGMVQGIIAGGYDALVRSIEGAEDRPEDGAKIIRERGITEKDVVCGIATSSTTSYVRGALTEAKNIGATTILLTCNPREKIDLEVDIIIAPLVGPEVITGSTRMKAGTATKMILNMLTTTSMIKMGKVYGNLMVDLQATNKKLIDRGRRIISTLTGISYEEAAELLEKAKRNVKAAIVMEKSGVSYEEAMERLKKYDGAVRRAIENL